MSTGLRCIKKLTCCIQIVNPAANFNLKQIGSDQIRVLIAKGKNKKGEGWGWGEVEVRRASHPAGVARHAI